jgi:hypothetical protein
VTPGVVCVDQVSKLRFGRIELDLHELHIVAMGRSRVIARREV